jgi:hypothetical protein
LQHTRVLYVLYVQYLYVLVLYHRVWLRPSDLQKEPVFHPSSFVVTVHRLFVSHSIVPLLDQPKPRSTVYYCTLTQSFAPRSVHCSRSFPSPIPNDSATQRNAAITFPALSYPRNCPLSAPRSLVIRSHIHDPSDPSIHPTVALLCYRTSTVLAQVPPPPPGHRTATRRSLDPESVDADRTWIWIWIWIWICLRNPTSPKRNPTPGHDHLRAPLRSSHTTGMGGPTNQDRGHPSVADP